LFLKGFLHKICFALGFEKLSEKSFYGVFKSSFVKLSIIY